MENKKQRYCKGCGTCCKAIWLSISMEEIKKKLDPPSPIEDKDLEFVVKNFIPITIEEAIKINPNIENWHKDWFKKRMHDKLNHGINFVNLTFIEYLESKNSHFFKCLKFDEKNNKCLVHDLEEKPILCKNYPFYGRDYIEAGIQFYTPNCGYNIEELSEITYFNKLSKIEDKELENSGPFIAGK